jgi:hypothetical protein
MFSIRITDEPLVEAEPGEKGHVGLLVLGSHKETFVAHTWTWSEHEYASQWERALIRALHKEPSALITDMLTPIESSHLIWWPMWRIDREIVFHNQLFFFGQHQVEGSHIDIEVLYGFIGKRVSYDDDGTPISEWTVPVSDVEIFLGSR